MTGNTNDAGERRRAQWRAASKKRRDARRAAGLPSERGPSGGTATNAERQQRFRERQKTVDCSVDGGEE